MIGSRVRLLALAGLALAASLGGGAPAAAATSSSCPRVSFLEYGGGIYRSYGVPASVDLAPGGSLGSATVDEPGGSDGCSRSQRDVDVQRYADVDPRVAVQVADRPELIFVLGSKCYGLVGDARWSCFTDPLTYRGRTYVATAYPRVPAPRKTLPLGAALGEATLAGQSVQARRIAGVDPAVAVGVGGRPSEAFVALGPCPYEAFSNRPALDDLRRCLTAPVWLVFDPPGARVGQHAVARADRRLREGQTIHVALVPNPAAGDVVPRGRGAATALGTLASGGGSSPAELSFDVPDVAPGRYEAVATCPACAGAHEGKTVFPAGTFVVGPKQGSGGRLVFVLLGVALVVLAGAAFYIRRRRWTRGGGPSGKPSR